VKQAVLYTGILALVALSACQLEDQLAVPKFGDSEFIGETYPLDSAQKNLLEGVYAVESGGDRFGSPVVVKWNSRIRMTILSGQDVSYFVLQAGRLDSVFFFEGYWRSQNSRRTGLARFVMAKDEGGRRLLGDVTAPAGMVLRGEIGEGNDRPAIPVVFRYQRAIRPEVLAQKFWILAHRGGGRTSDLIPQSENTVELIRIAESYGANAIEIDVRLSKDGVPILYHDNTLNPRLVQKTPMLGSVEDYTWPQLRSFVVLLNGEHIPTLEEALYTVVYETNLKFVWLDTKTEERDLIQRMVPLLQQYTALADVEVGKGVRDSLEIMVGVPSDEVYQELTRYPGFTSVPSIAEKSLEKARVLDARVWAPLWSGGINPADNAVARGEGRRIFVWTLDEPDFVRQYINSGEYTGILSNYPMIVAYYHYVR